MTYHRPPHSWLHPILVIFLLGSFGYGVVMWIYGIVKTMIGG